MNAFTEKKTGPVPKPFKQGESLLGKRDREPAVWATRHAYDVHVRILTAGRKRDSNRSAGTPHAHCPRHLRETLLFKLARPRVERGKVCHALMGRCTHMCRCKCHTHLGLARLSRLPLTVTSLEIQATGAPAWDAAVQRASNSLGRVGRHTDCRALMLHARKHRHAHAHLKLARCRASLATLSERK